MATLYFLMRVLSERADAARDQIRQHDDRGSITLEQVLWALGMFLLAGVCIAAITAFVNGKLALIN